MLYINFIYQCYISLLYIYVSMFLQYINIYINILFVTVMLFYGHRPTFRTDVEDDIKTTGGYRIHFLLQFLVAPETGKHIQVSSHPPFGVVL